MKFQALANPISYTSTQLSPSIFVFHFPSLSRENSKFLHITHTKSLSIPKPPNWPSLKASTSSDSVIYGGWDAAGLGIDSVDSGDFTQLRDFLVSTGIDDKRQVFMFLLGIVCAFSVSRVRISSIFVFPASVLVFAIGFSLGFVRGGSFREFSLNASKRKAKEEIFRAYGEKLRSLVEFLNGFDVKVNDLRNDILRAVDTEEIELGDLRNYVNTIESIKISASNARNLIEATIDSVGNSSKVLSESQKSPSKRSRGIGEVGFELLQFVGGLLGEKSVDSKTSKAKEKDNAKRASMEPLANDQPLVDPAIGEGVLETAASFEGNKSSIFTRGRRNQSNFDWDRERRIRIVSENATTNKDKISGRGKRFIENEDYFDQEERLRLVSNHHVSRKMDEGHQAESSTSSGNMLNSEDFGFSLNHMETESTYVREQMFEKFSGGHRSSYRKMTEDETYKSHFRQERMNDDFPMADHQSAPENKLGSSPSSVVSDDMLFDRYLTEANTLLKQAKECIKGKHDPEYAEIILCKSAKLLSRAIAMKPMSLLAVGQLGNTYLLHGELKLKISRELRIILSRRDPISVENQSRILSGLEDCVTKKDKVASVLVDVCEECEELLAEAGRKYRLALSIDGNDVRSLYNWGLALSFRGQLIADIGPEGAFDADGLFLAAIDKFNAMMSKGNAYAPHALFRWGVALQQRSRLRPTNNKEKAKLLQQAKRLYEDALHMDSDNVQVREALSSCISELNHRLFQSF